MSVQIESPFESRPIVFHFNNHQWRTQQKAVIGHLLSDIGNSTHLQNIGKLADLDIIVCNSRLEPGLTQECLHRMGIDYRWLGREERHWVNARKILLCNEFLRTADAEYVMHLDANDVIVRDHPAEILERFKTFNCDLLFNAEVYFYYHDCQGFGVGPYADLGHAIRQQQLDAYVGQALKRRSIHCECAMHRESENNRAFDHVWRGSFTYLNSGCWIGRTEFAREIFHELVQLLDQIGVFINDQPYMHIVHFRHYPKIRIDNRCLIFQCGTLCHEYDLLI